MKTKKTAIIIGGGFAGLNALERLARYRNLLNVQLIDKRTTFDFLPVLPDLIGRNVRPAHLQEDLKRFVAAHGATFIHDEVRSVDLAAQKVVTSAPSLPYDYLLIASGSRPNFYGNGEIENNACTVESVASVLRLKSSFESNRFRTYIVAGGGYTGVETATNIARFVRNKQHDKNILLVERAPSLLERLPEWMKRYVEANLASLGIEVRLNTTVSRIDDGKVVLSGNETLQPALVIWTAGVRTSDFVINLGLQKSPQGRIVVDEYLCAHPRCYVAGDAAAFMLHGMPVRMAVQAARTQGDCAARNIIRTMRGKRLIRYRWVDPGFIVPMANNRSCGLVAGATIKGLLPTALHYGVSVARTVSFNNKIGLLADVLFR